MRGRPTLRERDGVLCWIGVQLLFEDRLCVCGYDRVAERFDRLETLAHFVAEMMALREK